MVYLVMSFVCVSNLTAYTSKTFIPAIETSVSCAFLSCSMTHPPMPRHMAWKSPTLWTSIQRRASSTAVVRHGCCLPPCTRTASSRARVRATFIRWRTARCGRMRPSRCRRTFGPTLAR